MMRILHRELVYIWYYFDVQLRQIFPYWVLGMVLGSAVSVFAKEKIHNAVRSLSGKKLGAFGVIPASAFGIASPLCMYGTIPLAASFSRYGISDDWLAAFMMSSVLLNPQLIIYSAALGPTALAVRIASCFLYACGGGTIPLLQAWLMDGMSMGSAAAFMITGPATKITNLGALKIVLGIRNFVIYLIYVMVFAFVTGLVVNLLI